MSQDKIKNVEAVGLAGLEIRSMKEADLEQVLFSEADSYTMPWSREMFLIELAKKGYSYLVVAVDMTDDRIVAHACYWVIFEDLALMNVTVHPDFRRRGIGRKLMAWMIADGIKRGAYRASLEVRTTNRSAIGLYESFGFKTVGTRPRCYGKPEGNGFVMARLLRKIQID